MKLFSLIVTAAIAGLAVQWLYHEMSDLGRRFAFGILTGVVVGLVWPVNPWRRRSVADV